MRRTLTAILCASILSACAQSKTIDGVTYVPYGLLNKDEERVSCVTYEVSVGNMVMAVLFFGTVVAPIYVFGFATFEPKGLKTPNGCTPSSPGVPEAPK